MLSLNFSPFPLLKTERLLLRPISLDDSQELFKIRSDHNIQQFTNSAPDKSLEVTKDKIRQMLQMQEKNEAIVWAVAFKEDPGKLIGTIGFWRIILEHFRAEIGYQLNPLYWRKYIMKEALNAVIKYAFEEMNLHSIEANINPINTPSAALLESSGFRKEAYHKENFYYDGIFYDSIIYSRLINPFIY